MDACGVSRCETRLSDALWMALRQWWLRVGGDMAGVLEREGSDGAIEGA